jgi:hypothetical protein
MAFSAINKRSITVALLLATWTGCVAFGLRVLWQYSQTPSRAANPPASWPAGTALTKLRGRSSLLLFVHPECPCSRASLGELARILAAAPGRLDASVLFSIPDGDPLGWSQSDLIRSAMAIPGVRVVHDTNGATARAFGVRTSGQTLFYGADGRLAFNGGITASRGHSGDNDGSDAVMALLLEHSPRHPNTPVFGCALVSE